MYIFITKAQVFKTIPLNDRVIIDLDKNGGIIGVELLDASHQVSQELIHSSIQIGDRLLSEKEVKKNLLDPKKMNLMYR